MDRVREAVTKWLVPVFFGCVLVFNTLGLIAGASLAMAQEPGGAPGADLRTEMDHLRTIVEGWERRGAQLQSLIGILLAVNTLYAIALAASTYLNLRPVFESARRELDDLRRFVKETEDRIKETEKTAKSDLAEFRSEIRADLPTLQNMDKALRNILHQLRRLLPVDQDWRDPAYYPALSPRQREDILFAERTVAGFRFFELGKVPTFRRLVAEIHQGLGQFYGSQYAAIKTAGKSEDSLFAHGMMYFDEACDIDPDYAGVYKDIGVLHTVAGSEEQQRRAARRAFERSRALHPTEPGALFGLSWIEYMDGDLKKSVETIAGLTAKNDWQPGERRKYLADAYVNLACFRAKLIPADAADTELRPVLADLTKGRDVAQEEGTVDKFVAWVKGEFATGDLVRLRERFPEETAKLTG